LRSYRRIKKSDQTHDIWESQMSTQPIARAEEVSIVPPFSSEVLSAEEFKSAFRNHAAGVAIVTADAGEGPVAMTATSVFSVSAEPPLFVFAASDSSSSTPTLRESQTVVVHLPGADQIHLAKMASTTGANRFPDGLWARLPTGEPIYPDANVWIRGRIVNRLDAGSSTIFVVEALSASAPKAGSEEADAHTARPLVYHNRTWHALDDASRL
jgi:flavin reductase (DIM6/NTAB) family NADH-FMN oxidoreductase RutF